MYACRILLIMIPETYLDQFEPLTNNKKSIFVHGENAVMLRDPKGSMFHVIYIYVFCHT